MHADTLGENNMQEHITIVEVGPRDGLQNEQQPISTATKLELIQRLAASGLTHIEAGAFVSPKWVPQMADSANVLRALPQDGAVAYPVLVPNEQGLDAALAAGAREIAIFAAASESFSQRNIHASIAESLRRFEPVCARALAEGIKVRGYVSCVVGCPYEGAIAPAQVAQVARALHDMGCYEISLGDTVGVGTPNTVLTMLDAVSLQVPVAQLAGHFHDTYGMAIANVYASLRAGLRTFDASVAGLGGCPYARGASGNVATEDVVYLLHGLGYHTGIDLTRLTDTAQFIAHALGREPASHRPAP
ncbi:hydroxymethylglutaryl-CoA lyase [Paludibacterium denitrificans]|uniref:hydroxymethylglutaryl-CoA lyase n=1 Tax=Paludibacterium denitrificans TaxID=2675226 RepID=UPI0028AA76E2|nr:hydroxymethylglutaryl-CoA lyase [Paludibacterium denitrificans]